MGNENKGEVALVDEQAYMETLLDLACNSPHNEQMSNIILTFIIISLCPSSGIDSGNDTQCHRKPVH
jgi:hypothetical protein